jgi:hypothetical protein
VKSDDHREVTRGADRRNRQLRPLKERPDDLALLVGELLLEDHRDALPVRIGASAFDRIVELPVEQRLISRQLTVRADEDRQIREIGLIDVADVGEIRGDGAGRQENRCHDGADNQR